jgi:secreted PhoX family phosphatase
MSLSRRNFFKIAGASAVGVSMLSPLEALYARAANGQVAGGIGYGPLEPKLPENADELVDIIFSGVNLAVTPALALPPGFNYTVISCTGQQMDDGASVPGLHDGMAAFAGPKNTTILVRNHEVGANGANAVIGLPRYDQVGGGTTNVVVGPNRRVRKHFVSLAGTIRNCAGGPTPWGSWISSEENLTLPSGTSTGAQKKHGYNFEVPATEEIQIAQPIPLVAMGRFNHEAVAIDPNTGYVYETEDDGNGCFYRFRPRNDFRPTQYGDFQDPNRAGSGVLEALVLDIPGRPSPVNTRTNFLQYKNLPLPVRWVPINNPDPDTNAFPTSCRGQGQAQGAAIFSRGEGIWYGNDLVYFACTNGGNVGQGQIFAYNPKDDTLTLVFESPDAEVLNAPDNICVAPFGDIFICEDGSGTEYVHGINGDGKIYRFASNALPSPFNGSEFAGVCFSPDGRTLFVNIQSPGITMAVWGPWNRKRA